MFIKRDNEAEMLGIYYLINVSNFPSLVSSSLPLFMPPCCSWWTSAVSPRPQPVPLTFAISNMLYAVLALSLMSVFVPSAFSNSFSSPSVVYQS